jgi:hypothetical protein
MTLIKLELAKLTARGDEFGEPDFNRSVDEQHKDGLILIANTPFRPSQILYTMDPKAYEAARLEYQERKIEDLKDLVKLEFPYPIAHCFARYLHSWDTQNQRLQFLKDTWEATIAVLFALALGDARDLGSRLPSGAAHCEYVQSQTIWERISVVREICRNAPDLVLSEVVNEATLDRIETLNQARNEDLAHMATLNELQSQDLIRELEPELLEVLRSLDGLQRFELVRYLRPGKRGTANIETFVGETNRRTIDHDRALSAEQARCFAGVGNEEIVALYGDRAFRLSPMICWEESQTGHRSDLSFFKKKQGKDSERILTFEVFGASREYTSNEPALLEDLDAMKAVFIAAPKAKKAGA